MRKHGIHKPKAPFSLRILREPQNARNFSRPPKKSALARRNLSKASNRVRPLVNHTNTHAENAVSLSKFLANAGIASRRKAVDLIKAGEVFVNGTLVTEPGFKLNPTDIVKHQDAIIKRPDHLYVLLNKPTGYITTTEDDQDRRTVMDLLPKFFIQRGLFPVGRLDRETTGLLLITNDGELAQRLAHPKYDIRKVYCATLDRALTPRDCDHLRQGIHLRDGFIKPDRVAIVAGSRGYRVLVHIHSGKKHIIRRLFARLEYRVTELDRVGYAGLGQRGLACGQWRALTPSEVAMLKAMSSANL